MDHAVRPQGSSATGKRDGPHPGWIVIGRHGRPKADRTQRMDWRAYDKWWAQYEKDGLAAGQTPPAALIDIAKHADSVFSSTRARAIETAQAVVHDKKIMADPVFVEAPLPAPPVPGKRAPPAWGVWARVAWWLGRAAGQETRGQAELRAEAAVATLTARALRGENVMLFAHGWFNRMMRPVLKRAGWVCVEDGKDDYWSFRKYEKRGGHV